MHAPTDIWTYLIYGHHTSARAAGNTYTNKNTRTYTYQQLPHGSFSMLCLAAVRPFFQFSILWSLKPKKETNEVRGYFEPRAGGEVRIFGFYYNRSKVYRKSR